MFFFFYKIRFLGVQTLTSGEQKMVLKCKNCATLNLNISVSSKTLVAAKSIEKPQVSPIFLGE